MPNKSQIKAAVQSFVAQQLGTIIPVQNRYFNSPNHRVHFQGIATPVIPPDDGATVPADYNLKPTDQVEAWEDVFAGDDKLPADVVCQMQIDVYDGPIGKGWTLTARATKNTDWLWKRWNFGPETWRETDWQEYTAE